ncbi:maltokinase N-terminal cap-like domain-containing protein [Nakamurella endophytica]|uniref:Maltokinase n=1 Tax=Nakamurella endophytica TaxID=1748367 RepID=A0A917WCV8_9ACTN|nr:hypothetical protein [Nakamurella endophytica]GGL90712.1 aminoglycoside phosphotransferase [Nakamurella endophytica]
MTTPENTPAAGPPGDGRRPVPPPTEGVGGESDDTRGAGDTAADSGAAGGASATPGTGGGDDRAGASDEVLVELLTGWMPAQRWFSGKGRTLGPVEVLSRTPVAVVRGDAVIDHVVVAVDAGGQRQRYQLWIGWHPWLPSILDHARIGSSGNWTAYDGLQDGEVSALLLDALATDRTVGDLRFRREPDAEIDATAPGLVIGAEQSNTSVIYGQSSILKIFRRLEPGPNPDAEVHRALHAAGSTHVAAPLGEITGPVEGVETTLGLLTSFFAGSAEGWAMATASVRDLMAEGDLRADEVGGDWASESRRLGRAVAEVHADLAAAFGTAELGPEELAGLTDTMIATAEDTAEHVPSIAQALDRIRAAFRAAAGVGGPVTVQRIHGDLHLGQTLRVLNGWAIIDFEGEPSKPLDHRRSRHSPLRDVAGMLRSFDYAAHHSLAGGPSDAQHLYRATEWANRNRNAFCEGYAAASGVDPRSFGPLLGAFELDKAVYEVAYEHGNRPGWEPIPLLAVKRLTESGPVSGGTS